MHLRIILVRPSAGFAGSNGLRRRREEVDLNDANRINKRLVKECFIVSRVPDHSTPSGLLDSESQTPRGGGRSKGRGKGKNSKAKGVPTANTAPAQIKLRNQRYFCPGTGEEAQILLPFELTDDDAEGEAVSPGYQVRVFHRRLQIDAEPSSRVNGSASLRPLAGPRWRRRK